MQRHWVPYVPRSLATWLTVTEAEGAAGVTEAQDMLFMYNILKSLGLKVQLPMVLEMDNKGAVDLANSWSIGATHIMLMSESTSWES